MAASQLEKKIIILNDSFQMADVYECVSESFSQMISGILLANESVFVNSVARRRTTFLLQICSEISLAATSRSQSVRSRACFCFCKYFFFLPPLMNA